MAGLFEIPLAALTPAEALARLGVFRGTIFFDTAFECATASAISILATTPSEVMEGCSENDWELLRAKIAARRQSTEIDTGEPRGMAAGWVNYDGSFVFGFYEDSLIYRHAGQCWQHNDTSDFRPES